jgi:hypothetical protein
MFFSIVILMLFALTLLRYIRGINSSFNFINNSQISKSVNVGTLNSLAIIIPVYHENEIIYETMRYFNQINKKLSIDVFYVTTAKETLFPSTKDIITSVLGKRNVIHYPYDTGHKSHQLNFALNKLKSNYDFIGIFDADSRPDINGLRVMLSCSSTTNIAQMPSFYNTNYKKLNLFAKANSIFQTRWTMCYEIPQWLKWERAKSDNLMYLVGHGLFINTDDITEVVFYENTITEDLYFGYESSLGNKKLYLIPFFDYCSCPKTLIGGIGQSSRWYYEEILMPFRFVTKIKSINLLMKLCVRYFHILAWAFGPLFLLTVLITTIVNHYIYLTIILVIEVAVYIIVLNYHLLRQFGLYSWQYFTIFIKSITNCLGPLLCIIKILFRRKILFNKTRR